ncbi:MAG: hypothetical protein RI567_14520, partial [Marinobacter sp.]|nr:hypothetical protein [Marinobacter sp.]
SSYEHGGGYMADYPVKDENYDLISTLYHASQGLHHTKQYIKDAEKGGASEVVEFFKDIESIYQELNDKAKAELKNRL